jgi:hypothetical protein
MRRVFTSITLLILFASTLIAQTGNGSIGGIIQDPSKALLPGVTITLTNTATGVVTTQISNEAGAYQFQAVPPGTYSLKAELPSFKQAVANGVTVGTNAAVRRDFTLEIGNLSSVVEVAVAADQLMTEAAATVGVVLPQRVVTDLPLVGQNVLSLLDVLPGFKAGATDSASTIGGLSLDYTNTTINGLSTVSSRDSASTWGRQVMTTNTINPDLVGEIRLILSPVDAELGRGNSQIQISTRSGTNKYNGAVVWNVQNTALNANTWANKRNPTLTDPDWYNLNQITASYGGPIIRNKTFFFALFDKQIVNRRQLVSTAVLTDTARQGIWRYWEGWNPGAALLADPTTFAAPGATPTGTAASVNFDGTPLAPKFNPTGGPYTLGGLRCFSIYGNQKVTPTGMAPFTAADCPGGTAVINGSPWDSLRTTVDSTGYIRNILAQMPVANHFASTGGANGTDGLNTATYRWLQGRKGPTATGATNAAIGVVNGVGDYNNRNQINLKIDHNFSDRHRVSFSWTYEKTSGDANAASWGSGLNAGSSREPQFATINATSTISSNIVNEGRFGLNLSAEFAYSPWTHLDNSAIRDAGQEYIMYGSANADNGRLYPVLYNPGTNWNGFMAFNGFDFANYSPLYNYADTIRWTRGKHSFSFGGEYRRPSTVGYNGTAYIGANPGNAGGNSTPLFFATLTNGAAQLPGLLAGTRGNVGTLNSVLYGAINTPTTGYWIDGQDDITSGQWQDVTTADNRFKSADPYGHQTRSQISNEWSFFGKDDFKMTRNLTVNIGLRWDFTGSPYLTRGLTNTLADEGYGAFGASRKPGVDPFSTWLTPGDLYLSGYGSTAANPLACTVGTVNPAGIPTSTCDPNLQSKVIFVGPETDNPDKTLVPQKGAFSPAIGFSYQLPWFGEGKTTIRGGFQRTYGRPGSSFQGGLVSGPGGSSNSAADNTRLAPIFATRAANLTDLPLAVPSAPTRAKPEDLTFRVGTRSGALSTYALYDPDFKVPHTDNFTLTVTRSLSRSFTMEVRAVNTLARDQQGTGGFFQSAGTYDINTVNVYHNPELFNALEVTRAGGNSPLFDQMLMGLNLNTTQAGYAAVGTTPTGGVLQRGSAHIRRAFAANLANGNYVGVINSLLGANTTNGLRALPTDPATGQQLATSQRVLRNGCDRLANGLATGFVNPDNGQSVTPRCFSENYFVQNPQWSTALYSENLGYSNNNSVEVQLTMRPVHGVSFMATYGLSKQMLQPGNGFTDPKNPERDFGLGNNSVGSDFRANGTIELPIGPNKLLLANSSGWLARMTERWQMGFIYNVSSGAPRSFWAPNMLYANGRPNIVGPWENPKGSVRWNGQNGHFFDDSYITYQDPQCLNVTTADNLRASCTLEGLAKVVTHLTPGAVLINPATNTYGIKLLETPQPGTQGNLGARTMNTFSQWRLDGNLSKTFQVREAVSAQLRIDATNILNHPTPVDPSGLAGNTTNSFVDNFGLITSKTGNRTFQAKLRVTF